MSTDFIPEEKLLNLIKEQKEKSISEDKITLPADKFANLSSGIKKQGLNLSEELSRVLSPRNITIALGVIFGLTALIFVLNSRKDYSKADPIDIPLANTAVKTAGNISAKKIEGNILTENAPIVQEPAADDSANKEINYDFVKNFTLSGVIFGDNPQAIIFDKETLETYYVSKGESIGDAQIENVTENGVVINYKGKHFELFL